MMMILEKAIDSGKPTRIEIYCDGTCFCDSRRTHHHDAVVVVDNNDQT